MSAAAEVRRIAALKQAPANKKRVEEIIAHMKTHGTTTYQFCGTITDGSAALLREEGFTIEVSLVKAVGKCSCDYTETCDNHDTTWTKVSA